MRSPRYAKIQDGTYTVYGSLNDYLLDNEDVFSPEDWAAINGLQMGESVNVWFKTRVVNVARVDGMEFSING